MIEQTTARTVLDGIKARAASVASVAGTPDAAGQHFRVEAFLLAEEDVARLTAALEAVLELADELDQEAEASDKASHNIRYAMRRLSEYDRALAIEHTHHATVARNHALRIRAAVEAALTKDGQ